VNGETKSSRRQWQCVCVLGLASTKAVSYMIGTTFGVHLRPGSKEAFWMDLTQRDPIPYGSLIYYQVNLLLYARLLKRFKAVTCSHALSDYSRMRLSTLMCIGLYRFTRLIFITSPHLESYCLYPVNSILYLRYGLQAAFELITC